MKNNTRIRTTSPLITTREHAERVLGEIAGLSIQRNSHRNEMDKAIQHIRDEHEPHLAAIDRSLKEKTDLLRTWAETNSHEFAKRRSISLLHGTIGWRLGTPKLKTIARRTWATVLETLKGTGRTDLVRVKEETNKELILAQAASGSLAPSDLKAIGVQVVQEDAFYVEPKLEPEGIQP